MKERDRWEKFIIHWDIQDDGDDVVDDDDDAKQLNLSESLPIASMLLLFLVDATNARTY